MRQKLSMCCSKSRLFWSSETAEHLQLFRLLSARVLEIVCVCVQLFSQNVHFWALNKLMKESLLDVLFSSFCCAKRFFPCIELGQSSWRKMAMWLHYGLFTLAWNFLAARNSRPVGIPTFLLWDCTQKANLEFQQNSPRNIGCIHTCKTFFSLRDKFPQVWKLLKRRKKKKKPLRESCHKPNSHLRGFFSQRETFLTNFSQVWRYLVFFDEFYSNSVWFVCASGSGKVGIPTGIEFLVAEKNLTQVWTGLYTCSVSASVRRFSVSSSPRCILYVSSSWYFASGL